MVEETTMRHKKLNLHKQYSAINEVASGSQKLFKEMANSKNRKKQINHKKFDTMY
jgi:hypothetical protein